jgi:alanine racemase
MAVVKANAYGHGVSEVASSLPNANAFAVARVEDGVYLRELQPDIPIVVLEGYLDRAEANACEEYQLTPVIHSDYQLPLLSDHQPFWLKFNTGMFRLGFSSSSTGTLVAQLADKNLLGLMTHLANAEDPDNARNEQQIQEFAICCAGFPAAPRCVGNSGAILQLPQGGTDWVRPGLMLYGGSPNGSPLPELKPGMTVSAPVISINQLTAGDAVGYGSVWQADKSCRVAVIGFGYADGYPREMPEGTPVLVNGKRRGLVGRVSMDMCTVLLEDEDQPSPGDHCIFWGEGLPIDEIAAAAGTISYTLMTGLSPRVKRVFNY